MSQARPLDAFATSRPGEPVRRIEGASGAARGSSPHLKAVLDIFASVIHERSFQAAANAFVTQVDVRLSCDRVSLGLVRRGSAVLRSMSHAAQPPKKTNLVRGIEAAMDEALDQEESICFSNHSREDGPESRITRFHGELARHGASSTCSVLLRIEGRVSGVLTLERPGDAPFDPEAVLFCQTALDVIGPFLHLKRRDERRLFAHASESLTSLLARFFGPGHLVWKTASLAIASVLVFLCLACAEHRVAAKAILEGSVQRAAVAPFDGYIREAPVRAGDVVSQRDVLCRLEDRDLTLELSEVDSRREQLTRQKRQAMAKLDAVEIKVVSAQLEQAGARRALLEYQLSRTEIRAPLDGVVVGGDLSQSIGAPVQRGDVLFEITPLEDYRVVLEVDERDIAEVTVGQRGHLVLAAFPGERTPLSVERITPVSSSSEGRNYFRVEARLESSVSLNLRPGMEGIGKIGIDRRALIWIWTHRALDWLRLTSWSWFG